MENAKRLLWDIEQEILDVIDFVCKKNNLRYSIAYGTLLGAIRHSGFIPWDDDIDIVMPRDDYERLLEIWSLEVPSDYIVQHYKKDIDLVNNFAKIRKNHTTFLQSEFEKNRLYHKGIFVDIFPIDRVPKNIISRNLQYIACAINLLYTRGYTSNGRGLRTKCERMLLKLKKEKQIIVREKLESFIIRYNSQSNLSMFSFSTILDSKTYLPANLFDDLELKEFNGKYYSCTKLYDDVLKIWYGDYMKLPPKEEQVWKHHPILLDFNKNYEEISVNKIP